MAMGRPKAALVLSPWQREQFERMAHSRSLPVGLVTRVRIVLLSASGKTNQQITQRAIRGGTFRSVKELVAKIDQFVHTEDAKARPFAWTATADSIFAKGRATM
jgi:hypothetical protein